MERWLLPLVQRKILSKIFPGQLLTRSLRSRESKTQPLA